MRSRRRKEARGGIAGLLVWATGKERSRVIASRRPFLYRGDEYFDFLAVSVKCEEH